MPEPLHELQCLVAAAGSDGQEDRNRSKPARRRFSREVAQECLAGGGVVHGLRNEEGTAARPLLDHPEVLIALGLMALGDADAPQQQALAAGSMQLVSTAQRQASAELRAARRIADEGHRRWFGGPVHRRQPVRERRLVVVGDRPVDDQRVPRIAQVVSRVRERVQRRQERKGPRRGVPARFVLQIVKHHGIDRQRRDLRALALSRSPPAWRDRAPRAGASSHTSRCPGGARARSVQRESEPFAGRGLPRPDRTACCARSCRRVRDGRMTRVCCLGRSGFMLPGMKSCPQCKATNLDSVLVCACGHAFDVLSPASTVALSPDSPAPNLRGPSLLLKIGVAIAGFFLAGIPLAVLQTLLERSGKHVGPSYNAAYWGMGIFGAWVGLRFLKKRP